MRQHHEQIGHIDHIVAGELAAPSGRAGRPPVRQQIEKIRHIDHPVAVAIAGLCGATSATASISGVSNAPGEFGNPRT